MVSQNKLRVAGGSESRGKNKKGKSDFIKIEKLLCIQKQSEKGNLWNREKIFVNHIPANGLTSRTHENLLQLSNNHITNNPIQK